VANAIGPWDISQRNETECCAINASADTTFLL